MQVGLQAGAVPGAADGVGEGVEEGFGSDRAEVWWFGEGEGGVEEVGEEELGGLVPETEGEVLPGFGEVGPGFAWADEVDVEIGPLAGDASAGVSGEEEVEVFGEGGDAAAAEVVDEGLVVSFRLVFPRDVHGVVELAGVAEFVEVHPEDAAVDVGLADVFLGHGGAWQGVAAGADDGVDDAGDGLLVVGAGDFFDAGEAEEVCVDEADFVEVGEESGEEEFDVGGEGVAVGGGVGAEGGVELQEGDFQVDAALGGDGVPGGLDFFEAVGGEAVVDEVEVVVEVAGGCIDGGGHGDGESGEESLV